MTDIDSLPKLHIRGTIAPRDISDLFGESFSAADVIDFLEDHKDDKDIVVEISSFGGSVMEGKEIYTRLVQSGKNITTVTLKAFSIATLLMLAGRKRLITENADFGIHQALVQGDSLAGMVLFAEDLARILDETERATEDILNIYSRVLGEDKRTLLMAKMALDTNLGAREAIKMGFATGYYKKTGVPAEASNSKGLLITNHLSQLIKNKMADTDKNKDLLKSIDEKISMGFKSFAKFFRSNIKNVMHELDNGKMVDVVSANPEMPEELLNAKVFEVDEAGLPTQNPVADGAYTGKDGTAFTVAAGVITEVTPAVDADKLQEEKTALEDANKALTEEIAALKVDKEQSIKAFDEEKTQMKAEMDKIQMSFTEFKNAVPGDKSTKKEEAEVKLDFAKMSTAERVRAMSKERQKLALQNK